VTVIDDDEDGCEEIMDLLRDFSFEPSTVAGRFDDRLDEMVLAIEAEDPAFVICDNRLQARQLAQFHGSAVVTRLVARRRPSMLLTMYGSPDRLELRRSRFEIPVIVHREHFVPERLGDYYEVCRREIEQNPVDARRPHRSLIRIESVSLDGKTPEVDAVVPAWRPEHAIQIPVTCIDEAILQTLQAGDYLFGQVNIGAQDEDELYFHNLNERAPPPSEALA
jgi:hypothetical protein